MKSCVHIVISGEAGSGYSLEVSTNLLNWTNLAALSNTNGTMDFIDDPATNAQRMYRVKLAP